MFIFALVLFSSTRHSPALQEAQNPSVQTIGIDKLENPPVVVVGSNTLKVVSGKARFSVAGPRGSTFQFQPAVPKGSSFQTASLQVNGDDVALGRFSNDIAPALGYSPTAPDEIVVYRAMSRGKAQTLATYEVRTDGLALHSLPLKINGEVLSPTERKEGSFLVFGPTGPIGLAAHEQFSVDLCAFPSGPTDFETVYTKGDYAESPVVMHTVLGPRIGIEGLDKPFTPSTPASFKVTDVLQKGIQSVVVFLNGRRLAEYSDWQSPIALDLSSYHAGSYKLSILGKLSDGSSIGPETRTLEVQDRDSEQQKPVEPPPTIRDITIQSARYGVQNGPSRDVTDRVMAAVSSGATTIQVSNGTFGDPAPSQHKQLVVQYTLRGKAGTLTAPEDGVLDLAQALVGFGQNTAPGASQSGTFSGRSIRVLNASYHGQDVTDKVRAMLANGETSVHVDCYNLVGRDPAPGVHKFLTITVIDRDGSQMVFTGSDGDTISIVTQALPLLDGITNGSFDSQDVSPFISAMKYVPPGNGALASSGVFTIAYGVMRPFQLHPSLRSDFIQHTNGDSMALFVNPNPGRQPVLLWSEKVKVTPNSRYELSCYCSDISDNNLTSWASIVLQVDGIWSEPVVLDTVDDWRRVALYVRTGTKPYATIRIWRDVLPDYAESPSLIGLDDITLRPTGGR